MKTKKVGMIFGREFDSSGQLGEDSLGRCKKAVELFQQGTLEEFWVTTGYSFEEGESYMADLMKQELVSGGIPASSINLVYSGMNSLGEIDAFTEEFSGRSSIITISVIASSAHLMRIKMLWATRGWTVKAVRSEHSTSVKEWIFELMATISCLLYPTRSVRRLSPVPKEKNLGSIP